jgi:hypothetical protein
MNKLFTSTLLLSTLLGCGKTVSLDDRACPCASGWVCCTGQNICVAEGASCGSDGVNPPGPANVPPNEPVALATAQSPRCLAFDAAHVYWQNADGLVVGATKDGSKLDSSHFSTPLANNPRCGIAIDGDQLFTTHYQMGKVLRLSLTSNGDWSIGGASGALWGTGLQHPSSIAVDPDWVYVTDYDGGAVLKLSRADTEAPAVTIASGLSHPDDIALNGDYVFWLERGDVGGHNGHSRHVSKDGGQILGDEITLESPSHLVVRDNWMLLSSQSGDLIARDVFGTQGVGWHGDATGSVASDGAFVYWAASFGLRRDAPFQPDRRGYKYPSLITAMAVDDTQVFFIADQSVLRITKDLPHEDP